VIMDPFEAVIENVGPQGGMLSLQVAEIDMYIRLWCILELDTALRESVKITFLTSRRYEERWLASFLTVRKDPAAMEEKWKALRTDTVNATCGGFVDTITIYMKVLEFDFQSDLNPFYAENEIERVGANYRYRQGFQDKLNKMFGAQCDPEKWEKEKGPDWDRLWGTWQVWRDKYKNMPQWSCMNDRVDTYRKAQFNNSLLRLESTWTLAQRQDPLAPYVAPQAGRSAGYDEQFNLRRGDITYPNADNCINANLEYRTCRQCLTNNGWSTGQSASQATRSWCTSNNKCYSGPPSGPARAHCPDDGTIFVNSAFCR
jgi:hypothetical protein